MNPNLEMAWEYQVGCKALLKTLACWREVGTWDKDINPFVNFSQTKWQSNSTCLVRSWKTGLDAMYNAIKLLHLRGIGGIFVTSNSCKSLDNQANSIYTRRIERYSASAELSEIAICFFDFHDIGLPLSRMKKPLTNLHVIGQTA